MKKALSSILVVLMLLTMFPMSALAAEDDNADFGIENSNVTVTAVSEKVAEQLSEAARVRYWGLYAPDAETQYGKIHSACHIESSASPVPEYITITMNKPEQIDESRNGDEFPEATTGWAVLALVGEKIVTYPTTVESDNKLSFAVRLGESGTDFALACLTDASELSASTSPEGDWGTLTLNKGEIKFVDSLGYVRSYTLILDISDAIVNRLKTDPFVHNFDLIFYLNSVGLKIDTESISFEENHLFKLDPEKTNKISDGCYVFTAHVDINAWKSGNITEVVGISYAAPSVEPLLFEGEVQCVLPNANPWEDVGRFACVPLPLTIVEPPEDIADYYKITVESGDHGTITPSGVQGEMWVKNGESQTFTITPDEGYRIKEVKVDGEEVKVDGESQENVAEYTFENVTADHTISATFEADTYTITASAGDGGTISPSGEVSVNKGASQSFTITPNSGYHIADVLVDGKSVGAQATYTFTNVTAGHTISATFAADVVNYTIKASAGDNGSIDPAGDVTVAQNSDKTFTMKPNDGYHVADVKVNGESVGAVTTYTFKNIQANGTIEVTFARNSTGGGGGGGGTVSYIITASAADGGKIDPNGKVSVTYNSDKTFTITPDRGYHIADVLVDGKSVGVVTTYKFENIKANHTIEAVFKQNNAVADPADTGVADWLNTSDHIKYLHGYDTGAFGPGRNMTRAEVAQMFYNLLLNKNVATTVSFTDVAEDAWYAKAVNTLASIGVVKGVGDDQFAPERAITRAEFTVIAMRFAELDSSGENIFTDVSKDDWFYAQVVGSIKYGWISGYGDGTFRPNNTITRAEVTAITNRMLGRAADEDYVDAHAGVLHQFPDVDKNYWAYYSIMEATNAHDYRNSDGTEDWTGLKG